MARAYMSCGAFFQTKRIFTAADGFNVDAKTGRLRVVVFNGDPGEKHQHPKHEDGSVANCLGCPCRRKARRKEERVFPANADGTTRYTRPVPLVTCLIERQDDTPASGGAD